MTGVYAGDHVDSSHELICINQSAAYLSRLCQGNMLTFLLQMLVKKQTLDLSCAIVKMLKKGQVKALSI